jgi:hypothetical protein
MCSYNLHHTQSLLGPQQCVRKHFPLLSYLSQRKITLFFACFQVINLAWTGLEKPVVYLSIPGDFHKLQA